MGPSCDHDGDLSLSLSSCELGATGQESSNDAANPPFWRKLYHGTSFAPRDTQIPGHDAAQGESQAYLSSPTTLFGERAADVLAASVSGLRGPDPSCTVKSLSWSTGACTWASQTTSSSTLRWV